MRAIWSGAITFGLVNVPVKLYSATEDHDVDLHQVHDADGGRIRYQRRCEVCGKVVEYEDIDKAYADDEQTIVLTKKDLESIPQEHDRDITVVEFVPSDQLDPLLFDRSYYLEPAGKNAKAYVLLRRTLEKTDRTAVVHFALRQKTRLAALRVRGDALLLQTLLWPDEIREPDFPALDEKTRISAKEMQLSAALVESFSEDFDPSAFHDDYQEQLRTLIEAKRRAGDSLDTEETFGREESSGGQVIDLMEALKQSVERSRARKRGGAGKGESGKEETEKEKTGKDKTEKEKPGKPPSGKGGTAKQAGTAKKKSTVTRQKTPARKGA
ncbi:Ku protein [Arthrobacter sp. Y-9]|uniref:non-homologous end joining protein Ku n=1 Tax=Arthrobacter sp. Y-9 TaxID=3039385 RepID=UPI00241F82E4|nr:Ku protein [Arthrobacter sp. Y-9]WFR85346.1 Ku protein [Arthrobacter sp. Y-9]